MQENQKNQDATADDQQQSDSNYKSGQQGSTDQETDSEGDDKNEPLDKKSPNEEHAQGNLEEPKGSIVSRITKKSDLNINDQNETN